MYLATDKFTFFQIDVVIPRHVQGALKIIFQRV